jgi:anaerobic selenocysteine-containing dehydrogenase
VIQGLAREDLFTIVHERFLTDTARYADVVLPATSSLEQTDIFRSSGHYGVQISRQVIPPVGEAKSNWDTFRSLAAAMDFQEDFFRCSVDELIESQLAEPTPWLSKLDLDLVRAGEPMTLPLAEGYKLDFLTPSGKIEIVNPREEKPVPYYFEPYGGVGAFWLMTAPSIYTLNSSFNERPDLMDKKGAPQLQMNPADGSRLGFVDGQRIKAVNEQGESLFFLKLTSTVPAGLVVVDSVYWLRDLPGSRGVNALTSQKLTDAGCGSTFYDNKVDVMPG